MKNKPKIMRMGLLVLAAILIAVGVGFTTLKDTNAANSTYKILAWNDLGMHCYNRDFSDLAVLPPYNNLWVQVVQAGDPPKLVTSGITVTYSYPDNTYSVGKTNFWTYSQALFGVTLPPNVGLKGKGLSGNMDLSGDHFVAEGIPITEFSDSAPTVRQPYQLATVVVKDASTGSVLATQSVVTPTSSEMRCDKCHSDNGEAAPDRPTGKVETNILQKHDEEEGTKLMANRPVLCASCHASNALGAPGKSGVPNLSKAMHDQHSDEVPNTLDGCYNCHPGPQTRCLRDVMNTKEGMTCIDCHGGMSKVASNPNPWLNEPRCDTCHDPKRYSQNKALFRVSTDHGGLYCEACHDSTHAIAPSREANDAIKFIALQGKNGPLSECSVCHTTPPDQNLGPHAASFVPQTHVISGNAGAAGVTLQYSDGSAKTALADGSGKYSFSVSDKWSGVVKPVLTGVLSFTPASRTYSNVTTDQTSQNFKANKLNSFVSDAGKDGYIRETTRTSGVGGTINAGAVSFFVGDDANKRQYRGLVSFDTSALPDTAVIVSAKLRLKLQLIKGSDPFNSLGNLLMDISNPFFGAAAALGSDDFAAAASLNAGGSVANAPVGGVYTGSLSAAGLPKINTSGLTQLRLRFKTNDNNNASADYLAFFSGNATSAANRPVLEIIYYVP